MSDDTEYFYPWEEEPTQSTEKDSWKAEWVDMPEFVQDKKEPFAKIIVRFETQEDLEEFSRLIGQKLTPKTKSIWHPELVRGKTSHLRWKDKNSAS